MFCFPQGTDKINILKKAKQLKKFRLTFKLSDYQHHKVLEHVLDCNGPELKELRIETMQTYDFEGSVGEDPLTPCQWGDAASSFKAEDVSRFLLRHAQNLRSIHLRNMLSYLYTLRLHARLPFNDFFETLEDCFTLMNLEHAKFL